MLHNNLKNPLKKKRKRVARGIAAGQGKTAGRGHKGQKARTGKKLHPLFEGGQTPLFMKIPRLRGFKNINRVSFQVINITDLAKVNGNEINTVTLAEAGLIKAGAPIKILGNGDVEKKYTIEVDAISASAREKIEKAGGSVKVFIEKKNKETAPVAE
jgi:large subunit ribosomal protein L15